MIGHWARFLALACALVCSRAAPAQESPSALEESATPAISSARLGSPPKADPARTRAAIKEVLAQPEFADLHADPNAVWRRLAQWFAWLFSRVGSALEHLPTWVLWTIVVWMVLALAAMLGHLIYTLCRLLGGASWPSAAGPAVRRHQGEWLGIRDLEFDAVYAEACRLLTAGDWRAATKYYYVAAILWLDRQGAVAFRPSKTNRDYIGELRAQAGLQGPFSRLTDCFESIIYAGHAATAATSRDMAETVEGLFHEPARIATH
jgi:hypothetical protein